ncbi:hypothetical protein GT037_004208 [Alternaria burnsii]|uniref:Uncharacterized protein n=1 Tax=Alternaria burnsii TaxID=1187904 RepID=A0A8H7EIT9_9PLEO|nr:uncharacterized protein GT037_004208 [Alternaria burnsii]KAF7677349.1 hypothetical protein GT037_004208 [Alternaria burnsii]
MNVTPCRKTCFWKSCKIGCFIGLQISRPLIPGSKPPHSMVIWTSSTSTPVKGIVVCTL